jgi:CRP/FNR family transcriptional regulator, cyclic AMP receptor protein
MISQEFLAKIPIFERLSSADLQVLRTLWNPREFKQNDVLFRKGESGSSMYIIEEGTIEISVPAELEKKDIRVSLLSQGEFFGELSLVDGLPRTAKATALSDCRVLEMMRDHFIQFVTGRPTVAISMISEMGKRLRATNDLVTSLASKNVNVEMEEQLSFGDRLADKVADFVGSWTFVIYFFIGLLLWILLNVVEWIFRPFDAYPFVFLNLVLAVVASLQAPLIMMSQNRAQKQDRLKADLDYQVSLKSELMLQQLHVKTDEMRALEFQTMEEILKKELAYIRHQLQMLQDFPPNNPLEKNR